MTLRSRFIMLAGLLAVELCSASATAERCHLPMRFDVAMPFSAGDIPESVTTDHSGNLYISRGNQILQRSVAGELTVWATLPLPIFALGLKIGADRCVYNASTSLSEVPGAYVWRSCQPNSVEVYAELDHSGGPNDLAFDGRGNLYVTDPVLGRVWRIDSGGVPEVFVEDPLLQGDPDAPALLFRALGVNGIAVDERDRYIYLSNTDAGTILRVGLRTRHPVPAVVVESPLLRGADGVAFDRSGTLFVAVNASDSLVAVSPDREVRLVATGSPLDAPSSLAFGSMHRDRHVLYLLSSAFSRTLGLQDGTPQPALLTSAVRVPGLLLP